MENRLWKRLDAVEDSFLPGKGEIVVTNKYLDDSDEFINEKIDRWRLGEDVEGMPNDPRRGDETVVILRKFATYRDGSEVSQDAYEQWSDQAERTQL